MPTIYFDMDGTLADLYGVENWLYYLRNGYTKPYREAKSLCDMHRLGRLLNALQDKGYNISIISCTSKGGSEDYNERVAQAKLAWLNHHLSAVEWDEIHFITYDTPKNIFSHARDILFDDEERHREAWTGRAYDATEIFEVLACLLI